MKNGSAQTSEIDFVILWVDGDDPRWLAQKRQYVGAPGDDDRVQRYRDWGLLRYWFRGVERFAPWVHKIHFVTWGHLPAWLEAEHPKLHIVRHEDFMPPDCLPTFNCNALEVNLGRIEGLSEQFVYFNDDTLLIDTVSPGDFFRGGRPVDMLALQPVIANPKNPVMSHILLNDSLVISRHFDKRSQMKRFWPHYFRIGYPFRYFSYNLLETAFPQYTGFYTVHGPAPLLKSSYRELWEKEGDLLTRVSAHRFRCRDDVNQYLFREWEKQKGNFIPENLHRMFQYFNISDDPANMEQMILGRGRKMICLNDSDDTVDRERVMPILTSALNTILPDRSPYERVEREAIEDTKPEIAAIGL